MLIKKLTIQRSHVMMSKLFKYLITGSINFVVWFCIIWLMARMGFGYITYTAFAYFVAMTLSFFLNMYFTFSVRGQLTKRMAMFFSFNLINLLCVEILQYLLIEFLGFNDTLAILVGMGFYTSAGFFMNYLVVYKHRLGPDPQKTHRLIVCADDYGQNAPISEGILRLLQDKRINATSCLVNASHWRTWGKQLLPLTSTVFIGLHLNLTHGDALSPNWQTYYGLSFKKLPWLMIQAYTRRLRKDLLKKEIEHQLQHFIDTMGFFPDFIDGHEHIHQLPIIREVLLEIITTYKIMFGQEPTYPASVHGTLPQHHPACNFFFRTTTHHWYDCLSFSAFPKRALIALLGGLTFKRRLKQRRLKANTHFSGIYNFTRAPHYRRYFQQFLQESTDGGLIMCHPGLASTDLQDPLYQSRVLEMHYFLSDDYLTDLQTAKVELLEKID